MFLLKPFIEPHDTEIARELRIKIKQKTPGKSPRSKVVDTIVVI
jgi:hypothetical protein